MKAKLFIALPFSLLIAGCTPSGFSTLNLSGGNVPQNNSGGIGTGTPAETMSPGGPVAGQPGSITLAGGIVKSDAAGLKLVASIKAHQAPGSDPAIAGKAEIQRENQIQLLTDVETHHLNQIQDQNDFVLVGCSPQQSEVQALIRGLKPAQVNFELKDFLNIKAEVVVLCGKVNLSQAFVSIVADRLLLMNFSMQISNPNGVGGFSAMARNLSMIGSNGITSKGQNSAGAIIDAPSIFLYSQSEVTGSGNLELKSVGGNRLATGK